MKKLSGLIMIIFLVSCSNDSNSGSNADSQITGYELRFKSVFEDTALPTLETVTTGNLQNGKLFSETVENFSNDVSQGSPVTTQTHFYVGEDLVKQMDHHGYDRVREFYYDTAHNLIGAKMIIDGSSTSYYRIVPVSDAIVYFERLSLSYNDAAAVIQYRNVIELDANDNIIKAGRDANLDGIAESANQFSYAGNNLVSITWANSTVQHFDYSNVIDSFSVLNDKSYGKRNLRIIESESYVNAFADGKFPTANISSQELSANTYDVLSTNFYKKRTVIRNSSAPAGQNIATTEFFFD